MARSLLIALISTDYPPLRTSAAVQLRDLALQCAEQGHRPIVVVPSAITGTNWTLEKVDGIEVLRLAAPVTRARSLVRRAFAELWLPFAMLRNLRKSPLGAAQWDLVAWYSPPIFFAPLVWALRRASGARTYLILRDIFPEWAVDLGVLRKGPAYLFFKAFAALQYALADVIGVQTESNLAFVLTWQTARRRVEVLRNWLAVEANVGCSIAVRETSLAGRKIFVYIGNMGVAQGMDILVELVESLRDRQDIGFLFVGRGREFEQLVTKKAARGLNNVLFFNEIDSSEIPGLLAQCHVGLVALHPKHKTHNVPGKFVSYLQYGLPVLARVNAGTDIARLIEARGVGKVYVGDSVAELRRLAETLVDDDEARALMSERGSDLGRVMFSPATAARQIVNAALPHE